MQSSAMFVARRGTLLGTVDKTYAMLRQMVRVQQFKDPQRLQLAAGQVCHSISLEPRVAHNHPLHNRTLKIVLHAFVKRDDAKHGDLVFDLRCPSPTSVHGSVNVVHHFIGDSEDCMMDGFVRAVVDEMDDNGEELYNILIDSGADASIFSNEFDWPGPRC